MRIAYLTCVYPPYPGGIGITAQGMARTMAERGHSVEIFTPRWLRFGNAGLCPQLLWRLKNFDIIHVCYPFFGVAELVPFLKKLSRARIVVHHLMDAVAPGILGRVFAWHTKYIAPRIFREAASVLVLSEDYARNSEVANFGVQWEVVPNGVDTNLFCPKAKKELPITNYQLPIILFVGGLDRAHYFKGVEVLIKACAILQERGIKFRCQIVGEGEMRQKYERQAGGLAEFVGLVSHDQLPAYYQNAAVVVVPSTARVECFSIVGAEAQACGVPVIVSDFPGVRVTIEHGVTGFVVPPNDVEALAERIQWVVEHLQEAQTIGQAGRARIEQMYSWKVVGDKLEKVYASLYST